jgi:hypothetical protein
MYISRSVAFLSFWERFAFLKLGEGSNALRRATSQKLHYFAVTLRVTVEIIE